MGQTRSLTSGRSPSATGFHPLITDKKNCSLSEKNAFRWAIFRHLPAERFCFWRVCDGRMSVNPSFRLCKSSSALALLESNVNTFNPTHNETPRKYCQQRGRDTASETSRNQQEGLSVATSSPAQQDAASPSARLRLMALLAEAPRSSGDSSSVASLKQPSYHLAAFIWEQLPAPAQAHG